MNGDALFEVALCWELEDGVSLPLRVQGTITRYIPEIRATFSDPGSPAEGGDLEDVRVFSGARLEKHLEDRLLDDEAFLEAVRSRI